MGKSTSTVSTTVSTTVRNEKKIRRYWRRRSIRGGWWPGGWWPLLGLLLIFAYGAFETAPAIEARTADGVRAALLEAGWQDFTIEADGQGVVVRATGSQADAPRLEALASDTECDTWVAGRLVCPTSVRVEMTEPSTPEPVGDTDLCADRIAALVSSSTIEFATDSDDILPESRNVILELADLAIGCPIALSIEGHTDSLGAAEGNRLLSLARAEAVAVALTELGVDASRLSARGFGSDRPIADNSTADGRARNRRIEIIAADPQPQ